ncbi:variable surface protein, partial [Plasmodium gonderi]
MSKSIYNYIYLFSNCENTKKSINSAEEELFNLDCLQATDISEDISSEFSAICKNVMSYFNKMDAKKNDDEKIHDGTCVYLHYWLYYDYLKEKSNPN